MLKLAPDRMFIRAVVRFLRPDVDTPTSRETWNLLVLFAPLRGIGPEFAPEAATEPPSWYRGPPGSWTQEPPGWYDAKEAQRARALGRAVLEQVDGWPALLADALMKSSLTATLLPEVTKRGAVRAIQVDMPQITPQSAVALGVAMILSKHGLRERIVRKCRLIECGKLFYSLAEGRPTEYCLPKHRQRAMTLAYDPRFAGHKLRDKQLREIPARGAKHK